jgi:Flp pilus assembly protein TadD
MVGVRTFIGTGELVCDVCIWVYGAERKLRPATTRVERCLVEKRDTPSPVSVMIRVAILGALLLFLLSPDARSQDRPPAIEVQFHRAEAAWKTGASLHEAKARIDRVLEEIPGDVDARKLRAQVLLALERPAEALVDALRAVEIRPSDAEARLILCEVAIAADEQTLALRELNAASELIIDNAEFNLRLSVNAVQLGQLDRGEAFARTALSLAPRNPGSYYQLARVFVLRGQADEAVAVLERGFRGAALDPAVVREDVVLRTIAGHSDLRTFMSAR